MAVAAVIGASDMGEHTQLARAQRAIGNGDAQHVGVELQVDAVHQAQRLERVLGELAGKAALDLIAKLLDALGNKGMVKFVVTVHRLPQTAMNSGSAGA